MAEKKKDDQMLRVLQIYAKLTDGYVVNKAEEAALYGVNERSIQRDIDHIREFLDVDSKRSGIINTVVYDRIEKGFKLETIYKIRLQNSEVLALCKILLDSRYYYFSHNTINGEGRIKNDHSLLRRSASNSSITGKSESSFAKTASLSSRSSNSIV